MNHADQIADEIIGLFNTKGDLSYGEAVTVRSHSLQSAYFAAQEGATEYEVVAALLHDIGHLVHGLPEDIAEQGIDGQHEDLGEAYLSRHFPPEITEPVQMHVAAKRYLCAANPNYLAELSPTSRQSLALQGGVMNESETKEFESNPFFEAAIRLRRWDDLGKEVNLTVPSAEAYREAIARQVIS